MRWSAPTPVFSASSRSPASSAREWRSSSVVERRGIRYAHMVGVTPQIMQEGMRADYRLVDTPQPAAVRAHEACAAAARRDAVGHVVHRDRSIRRSRGSRRAG